ncbi:MAG: bifunctional hydroxymethylpyrimidine kinase/phosphomethylpyrimidine kinase, partial [Bacillota bacterium]|nr:bifunctional hydroxymethylpyrimidine kinase/phosphomethylpyrimidine kinase [Bacillota bacterium]
MKTVLTVAGSDSSGGAGIQADIKTMTANGVYAMSAITALTAQNTMGVSSILNIEGDFLAEQLESVFSDIMPDAVKIGMIASVQQVEVLSDILKKYRAKNIVLDPVLMATCGVQLTNRDVILAMMKNLFHLVTLLTPNLSETKILYEMLSGVSERDTAHGVHVSNSLCLETEEETRQIAKQLGDSLGCSILVKGGHRTQSADDLLYNRTAGTFTLYRQNRIDNPNTHGTGCTLSSAIASNLAKGTSLEESIRKAKNYLSAILTSDLNLGRGNGPLN